VFLEAHISVGMPRESLKGRPTYLYRGSTKVAVERSLGGLFAEAPDNFGAHQTNHTGASITQMDV
jgi:hypothetical protein